MIYNDQGSKLIKQLHSGVTLLCIGPHMPHNDAHHQCLVVGHQQGLVDVRLHEDQYVDQPQFTELIEVELADDGCSTSVRMEWSDKRPKPVHETLSCLLAISDQSQVSLSRVHYGNDEWESNDNDQSCESHEHVRYVAPRVPAVVVQVECGTDCKDQICLVNELKGFVEKEHFCQLFTSYPQFRVDKSCN